MRNKLIVFLTIVLFSVQGCLQTNGGSAVRKNAAQAPGFKLNTIEDLYAFLTYDENRYPVVSAHRGGPAAGFPENAIETFANVASRMPVIIECDIRLSKDSVLVLMHDETIDRASNGQGAVTGYTAQELKQFRLKDPDGNLTHAKIPTLEEALLWGAGKVIFTLDVKKGVPYQHVTDLIQKTNAQAYSVVITYNANQALAVHRSAPELMISANIKTKADLQRLYDAGIPDNRLVAFVGTRRPDKDLVEAIHAHGIKTILGTIGNLDQQAARSGYQAYAEYIEEGADILSTDRPFEAFKALDFYVRKRGLSSPFVNN